ncbi:MAG: cysteine desulfurase [Verrucomicrobiales bacterium]|nr:cysteine desulfurase [Verrucomicrobiales bacterium]
MDPPPTVYLDNAATTRVAPEVIAAMLPFHACAFGNASSRHRLGFQARRALERSRACIAAALGCRPAELVLTSGGTEANNLALFGGVAGARCSQPHVVISAVEHPSVARAAEVLERRGVGLTRVGVDAQCRVDPRAVMAAVRPGTVLVSVMLVNHEVGTIQPVAEIARCLQGRPMLLHADAVQAFGKLPLTVSGLGVDLLSVSAHKIHGPKGVGALYVRRGVSLGPRQMGGDQEHGLRAGTENVPAIVGFATAVKLVHRRGYDAMRRVAGLRDAFEREILRSIPGASVNGGRVARAGHISNLNFPGVPSRWLVAQLDACGVLASPGAACSCARPAPSPVLLAMGHTAATSRWAVRFSLSVETTVDQLTRSVEVLRRLTRCWRHPCSLRPPKC